jgi:hypothetical protein
MSPSIHNQSKTTKSQGLLKHNITPLQPVNGATTLTQFFFIKIRHFNKKEIHKFLILRSEISKRK